MNIDYEKELQTERSKLNKLIDEALKNGTPISKTQAIMKQSKKIKNLILENESVSAKFKRKERDGIKPALLCHPDYISPLYIPDE